MSDGASAFRRERDAPGAARLDWKIGAGKAWLEETGWKVLETRPLAGPQSVPLVEAI
jgi:hypothetical protein